MKKSEENTKNKLEKLSESLGDFNIFDNKNSRKDNNKRVNSSSFKTSEVIALLLLTIIVSLIMGSLVTYKFAYNSGKKIDGELQEFIENYEYGNKIEPTPYLPLREGYMFTGWYKEPECLKKWDFENDKLPAVEYDEEGNPTEFIETKLYAGWQKI